MKKQNKIEAKFYKLKQEVVPLTYMLASRNSQRYPLLWFDEEKGINRPLRYARNQKSPFEDDQDGNAILEPIVFEDGLLHVPKTNQVLQKFLYYHPQRDKVFEEINKERDARIELRRDILIYAKNNPIDFIDTLNDPMLEMQDNVYQFFNRGFLKFKNQSKDVYFNLPKNKKKLLTVPFGEDPYFIVASHFQSDEGVELYKLLMKRLESDKK